MKTTALFTFLCLAPLPGLAGDLYADSKAGCSVILASEDGILDYAAEGGLVLDASGYQSIEYHCSFEPKIDFKASGDQITTHMGYCMEPGPYITPQLFSVMLDPYLPGVVKVFTGADEPIEFFSCSS